MGEGRSEVSAGNISSRRRYKVRFPALRIGFTYDIELDWKTEGDMVKIERCLGGSGFDNIAESRLACWVSGTFRLQNNVAVLS